MVILKELVDNALDACEEAGFDPVIDVIVDETGISISDNGPGIPERTVEGILDYGVRVSSREAYVSPTRGAQGNAMKTILAMPYVLTCGDHGRVDIYTHGQRHEITFSVDHIRQEPTIGHVIQADAVVRNGSRVVVHWPDSSCSLLDHAKSRFLQLADSYTWLNPHLTLTVEWFGERIETAATTAGWTKWLPSEPTSPHWYGEEEFARLVAAYLKHDQDSNSDRSVRELVAEFRGLTGTAKQKSVLEETGLTRTKLSALADGESLRVGVLAKLLTSLKTHSKAINPTALGVIGEQHIRQRMEHAGCEMETFQYKRVCNIDDNGLPTVIEMAFGWRGVACEDARRLITGINWSAAITDPFRTLGGDEYDEDGLSALLENRRAGSDEPVIFLLHVAHPRVCYTDRGKSAVVMACDSRVLIDCIDAVTRKWTKQRKREDRDRNAILRRRLALVRCPRTTLKDAAYSVMEEAYLEASTNNTLPAHARQIMYRARGKILELTGLDRFGDAYFTQKLLPRYQKEFPEQTAGWDVVYDARGHYTEPHTGKTVPLGTLAVRGYLADVATHSVKPFDVDDFIAGSVWSFPTLGPQNRIRAVLYVEKEGFIPLFNAVSLAERYDIAIMSSKGLSVTACRLLVEHLCSKHDVPLLVLHDFDITGFSILGTLHRNTWRYSFRNRFEVIDLGLRLADVEAYGLESEDISPPRSDPTSTLLKNGATAEEVQFLLSRKRVELNAFTSGDFVRWIEAKLQENGITKLVPDQDTLATAYRRALQAQIVREQLDSIVRDAAEKAKVATVPTNLGRVVRKAFKADPTQSWDAVITETATGSCKTHEDRTAGIHLEDRAPKARKVTKALSPTEQAEPTVTLADLGIDSKLAARAMQLAAIPKGLVRECADSVKANGEELTRDHLLAFCRKHGRRGGAK